MLSPFGGEETEIRVCGSVVRLQFHRALEIFERYVELSFGARGVTDQIVQSGVVRKPCQRALEYSTCLLVTVGAEMGDSQTHVIERL